MMPEVLEKLLAELKLKPWLRPATIHLPNFRRPSSGRTVDQLITELRLQYLEGGVSDEDYQIVQAGLKSWFQAELNLVLYVVEPNTFFTWLKLVQQEAKEIAGTELLCPVFPADNDYLRVEIRFRHAEPAQRIRFLELLANQLLVIPV